MAESVTEELPSDSDVDLHDPRQRAELSRAPWAVLAAIAAGGALGALARFGISTAFPASGGEFGWATFFVNVVGCLLIGVLMVLIAEARSVHRLVRPFLGVGVLGGFTTFSTYAVDVQRMTDAGAAGTALLYLFGTVAAALLAVSAGSVGTRLLVARRRNWKVAR